ncbi:M24 family metallopeptidase [Mucispirillum schaedleri]|uniref:M24 family metallopeptidase n=1 Tax=Mucispirillum schaedleri TaxID=248039 RepID=UPI001F568F9A|nr:M24 family metallopeptidase [Mucispirillum schaedleri]
MYSKVPGAELINRLKKFTTFMDMADDTWRYIFIFNPVNIYYFTGTMQDGILFIQRDEEPVYFVKRSVERAAEEIRYCKVMAYKELQDIKNELALNVFFPAFVDKSFVTIKLLEEFNSQFEFGKIYSCDTALNMCRSVKSKYELDILKEAGAIHADIMTNIVPELLTEDISERDAALLIFNEFMKNGHQGIVRFERAGMEFQTVNVAFGESSLNIYKYDIPAGITGLYAASPFFGSSKITLKQNDLITIPSVFGINGYHSVCTYCYAFNSLIDYIRRQHEHCKTLKDLAVLILKSGAKASDIYTEIMDNIHPEIQGTFMGLGDSTLTHLGRGTGLAIDEFPIISKNNDKPLVENMVINLGFFSSLEGYGVTGMQHTYIVTAEGGVSINGQADDVIVAGKYL